MMADGFTRRRTLPPHKNGSGLSPRDQALARVEALLREELLPPPDEEEAGPAMAPDPVNLKEVVEIARLSPRPKPPAPAAVSRPEPPRPVSAPPLPTPAKTSPFHVILQALILLFVLSWVFILGIVVGRGHLWESGPVYGLVVWLEEKVGWDRAEEPPVIYVRETPAESDDDGGIDWEDVRRQYGYSDTSAAEELGSLPAVVPYQGPETSAAPAGGEDAAEASDNLTNSQWLSDASSLLIYDSPAVGYQERDDLPPVSEFDEDQDDAALSGQMAEDDEPAPAVEAPPAAPPSPPAAPVETGTAPPVSGAADGRYAVQVASPYEEAEAQRRVDRLQSQGFPAYYYKTSGNRYPVRVGRFATQTEADAARTRLDSLGYKGHYVSTLTD